MESIVYTPKEVAKILNLSVLTVYKLINKGDIPSISLGHSKRITKEAMQNILNPK